MFGVEKLVTSKLHEAVSNKRIFTVDRHIGLVCANMHRVYTVQCEVMSVPLSIQSVAGLIADARQVVGRARDEAANYRFTYAQPIPLKVGLLVSELFIAMFTVCPPPLQHLVDRVSGFMHVYTLYSAVRPFGCSIMFGSYGPDGPALYMADPSGVAWVSHLPLSTEQLLYSTLLYCTVLYCTVLQGYYGCAVGKAKQAAKTEIEKLQVCIRSRVYPLSVHWLRSSHVSDEGVDLSGAGKGGCKSVSFVISIPEPV